MKHDRYLALADVIASWSKDPSTKVGAIIVKDDKIIATGYNGYPKGVEDNHLEDKEYKLLRTIHAEENAIIQARQDLNGAYIFVSRHPCSHCTALLIQSGITGIFYNVDNPDLNGERWGSSMEAAKDMLKQSGTGLYPFSLIKGEEVCK